MPSGGSTPPESKAITLFIDRNSGGRTFRTLLESTELKVVLHDEVFSQRTADEDWLMDVGKRGWIVITGDNRTTHAPLFLQRLAQSNAFVFVLLALNGASADAKAAIIKSATPRMRELTCANQPPALWRIGRDNVVRQFEFQTTLARMHRRQSK